MAALHAVSLCARARVQVQHDHEPLPAGFTFENVPLPADNDAAASARFTLAGGQPDRNGAPLSALHDGAVPLSDDDPSHNFFFQAGSDCGRLVIDMTHDLAIAYIALVPFWEWTGMLNIAFKPAPCPKCGGATP